MDLFDLALYRALNKGGGGGDITVEPLTVTENGQYAAPSGKAYSPVNVEVSGGGVPSGYTPPSNSSGANGDLYIQKAKDGILKSDGYCYIDTLIYPRATYWPLIEFCQNTAGSNYDTLFGSRNGSIGRYTARFDSGATGNLVMQMSAAPGSEYYSSTLLIKKNAVVENFATARYTARLDNANDNNFPYTLYLFANNNAGLPGDYADASVKRFCLYDKDNICILYMVPAKDTNDVPCMYDLISGNYFYNSGEASHAFTYTNLETEKTAVIWQKNNGVWVPVMTN